MQSITDPRVIAMLTQRNSANGYQRKYRPCQRDSTGSHDLSEDEAVVLAIERYKKATGVDLPEGEVREAVRKRMTYSRS